MEELTQKQASKIVKYLMECIPYNINIMDKNGIIIASGEKKRIGTKHDDMKKAIDSKSIVIVNKDTLFSKKGTNEPIFFEGEIIGGVGITGDPPEVSPFAKLVRTVAQMLLEELKSYETVKRAEQNKKNFFNQLLDHNKWDATFIQQALELYQLDLSTEKIVLFSIDKKELNEHYPEKEIFSYKKGFLVFLDEEKEVTLSKNQIFISPLSLNLAFEVKNLWTTYLLVLFLGMNDRKIYSKDFQFLNQFFQAQFLLNHDLLKRVEEIFSDSYKTLIVFFNHDLSIGEAADELYIHRNTLRYRLDKIFHETGRNPLVVRDLLELLYYFGSVFMKDPERKESSF